MSAIGKILGFTGSSLANGTRVAGLGVSASITADLARTVHRSGYLQAAAGSTRGFFSNLFAPVAEHVTPHIKTFLGSSYVAPVVGGLAWAGKGIRSFAGDAFGAIFGRELLSSATLSTWGSALGLGNIAMPAFMLTSGHLGALGIAYPIARAGGKAVSQWLLKGQVARGLTSAYPTLSQEISQDIAKLAMKQGLGVPQRVAEVAGQLAQAHLKTGAGSTGALQALGIGGAAVGTAGLNLISSGAQSAPVPNSKLLNGFHV